MIENTYTADAKKLSRTTNGEVIYYVYDGDVVLEERTEINAEMARNVYGRNLIFRETRADSGYYSYNGHGDVVRWEYTNRNGYVEYEYDEFGEFYDEWRCLTHEKKKHLIQTIRYMK